MTFVVAVLCVGVVATLLATPAHAADLHNAKQSYQGLLSLIQSGAASWNARLLGYAKDLFWSLAAIQLVWTFLPLVLKGADIGEIVGELLRYVLVIGFFYEMLTNATTWATDVVDSFRQAGAAAAGVGQQLQPGDMFGFAVQMANTIGQAHTWNPLVAVMISLASVIVLLCFAFIAAFMGVTLVESYIVINASVLFLGFGGSQWTREYAMAMARYAVAVGAKLFVLTLLVGLIVSSAKTWEAAYNNDQASMWTMVGLSLVCAYLAKQIPDLVQSLITGTSMGGGSAIGGMAAAGAAGATAAIAAIATGGVGGIAAGAANAAGGAAGSAGGAAAGGGLAGLIDSAVMGGTKAAGAMGGGSGGPSAASTLAPRVGGAASAAKPMNGTASTGASSPVGRASTGGAQASGAAPTQNGSASPSSGASDAGGGEGAANGSGGPETASTAPSGAESGAPASGSAAQPGQTGSSASGGGMTARKAAHMGVAGAVRGAGILSSISVPGMEGAHGMSIGPHPGTPPKKDAGGGEGETWGSNDAASSQPENTIRPASSPGTPPSPPEGGNA
ncbi:MAG: P-type conjugative transfer protein TrbL [Acidiphilium sp.]|nr:P-type conjugative transfer protein TrbL [Acidiphilium sp.]